MRSDGLHESLALVNAEHATPLAGPTYRARTRYRFTEPCSAGETVPTGTWDRPAVLRLNPRRRGGEDVNLSPSQLSVLELPRRNSASDSYRLRYQSPVQIVGRFGDESAGLFGQQSRRLTITLLCQFLEQPCDCCVNCNR